MQTSLYPLLLEPALHVKVWGGRRLADTLGKQLPTDEPYGESWELHDTATVANGPLAGRSVGDLTQTFGAALIGPDNDPALGFPLLAKFLDANDWLSVQVHPNDEQARELDGEARGKTEAWYVLATEPGSTLVIGVQPGTTRDEIVAALRDSRLEDLLVHAPVVPGDVLFVATGTIHALGTGVLIYEIQQSSDLTYRFYDWGRLGLDGQPRALHIDKSLAVSNLDRLPDIKHTGDDTSAIVHLVSCPYFQTDLLQLQDDQTVTHSDNADRRRFTALTCIGGAAQLEAGDTAFTLDTGRTALIPASVEAYTLRGPARLLRSRQP